MTKTKEISKMSDKDLYKLCKHYGYMTLEARRKFIGLLPEVYKRKLFEKKRFGSIYEFAGKLAGVSNDQVDLTLRLEKKFEDKPVLLRALVEGEVSVNKLSRISSIATEENQEELFEKTKHLSNRAVEVFVRDVKHVSNLQNGEAKNENQNGLHKPKNDRKSVHVQEFAEGGSVHVQRTEEEKLELAQDVEKQLLELKDKGIDINEFLRSILKKRKEKIEKQKKEIGEEEMKKYREKMRGETGSSRYLNVRIRKVIAEEHGTKCSIPHCKKRAKTIHHTQRFALNPAHDPRFLAPLCREHHEIAHKIDARFLASDCDVPRWKTLAEVR